MDPLQIAIKSDVATVEQQIMYGEVYAPDRPDAHNEFMLSPEIEKMAHAFLRNGRMQQIDLMHNNELVDGCSVVESFIARKGDPDFIEGAWVVGIHIPDHDLWESVKKGDINGLSMEALVTRHPQDVQLEMPPIIQGLTTKSEDHVHQFFVAYSDEGKFMGGMTDIVDGHQHQIIAGTHTEKTDGHSHRFSSVDLLKISA